MHTPYDSKLFAPMYGTDAMRQWWSDRAIVQSWLDVEIALAATQAELGVIPEDAADAIAAAATLDGLDWDRLAAETQTVGMPIMPLLNAVGERGGPLVKRYLHWGSTTQDILDTGQALRLAGSIAVLREELRGFLAQLIDMAELHRATVMVARTNSQDALPTTWGLQVSGYLTEIARHLERLDELQSRACLGMIGGAVGTLASMGPQAIAVRDGTLTRLGLTVPDGAWNASLDGVAEVVLWTGLVHGTLGRLANDVEMQGRTATQELREGEGGGGSSTMPHKGNPRACNAIQGFARTGSTLASGAYALLGQVDVRAASMRAVQWTLVPEVMLTLSASLDRARRLVDQLVVDTERMRANFEHSRGFVMSEAVMMHLADKMGREPAYALVKRTLKEHDDGISALQTVLGRSDAIRSQMSDEELASACDPRGYLGVTEALIDEAIAKGQAVLAL